MRDLGSLKVASRCLRTQIQTSSEQQHHLNRELWDACSGEKILKEKKRSSHVTSMLDFLKSLSDTHASLPVLLNIGDDGPGDWPAFQEEVSHA